MLGCIVRGRVRHGPDLDAFRVEFARWLGTEHTVGAATGRAAFQLGLMAAELPAGSEIIFPAFTFPVMPMVAQMLGFKPVFCDVDPETLNAGPEHFAAKITVHTSAVLATHLFGRPAPIREIVDLCRSKDIKVFEDCAHACGVRVRGQQVGTFGDVGIFSFAQGKNMPCLGGGAIATGDVKIAERARILDALASTPASTDLVKEGVSIWGKWLLTRPLVFGATVFQALRLKQALGKPLLDSAVGDELLMKFANSNPKIESLSNLQAAVGRRQIRHIDSFNYGARANGEILTESIGAGLNGVGVPPASQDHIFVYYPLRMDPQRRDELRHHLLRQGVDTKTTDMADCSTLRAFRGEGDVDTEPTQESMLEICVYPAIAADRIRKVGRAIREWALQQQAIPHAPMRPVQKRETA